MTNCTKLVTIVNIKKFLARFLQIVTTCTLTSFGNIPISLILLLCFELNNGGVPSFQLMNMNSNPPFLPWVFAFTRFVSLSIFWVMLSLSEKKSFNRLDWISNRQELSWLMSVSIHIYTLYSFFFKSICPSYKPRTLQPTLNLYQQDPRTFWNWFFLTTITCRHLQ